MLRAACNCIPTNLQVKFVLANTLRALKSVEYSGNGKSRAIDWLDRAGRYLYIEHQQHTKFPKRINSRNTFTCFYFQKFVRTELIVMLGRNFTRSSCFENS